MVIDLTERIKFESKFSSHLYLHITKMVTLMRYLRSSIIVRLDAIILRLPLEGVCKFKRRDIEHCVLSDIMGSRSLLRMVLNDKRTKYTKIYILAKRKS